MMIDFGAEGFPKGGLVHVNPGAGDQLIIVRAYDNEDRMLVLDARITRLALGSLKVRMSLPCLHGALIKLAEGLPLYM